MTRSITRFLNTASYVNHEAPTSSETPTTETETIAYDGEALADIAKGFGSKVNPDTEAAVSVAVQGKADWQGGPIIVLGRLQENFGDDMALWPEPGSKTGNNPDKFKVPVTDSNGKTTLRPQSFYGNFTDTTPSGAARQVRSNLLTRANNPEAIKTDIPEDIMAMDVSERDDEIRRLKNERNNSKTAYYNAVRLYWQLNAFEELAQYVDADGNVNADPEKNTFRKAGSVGCDFIYETNADGTDGAVKDVPQPITIWEYAGYNAKGEPRPHKNVTKVSVGSFLRFKCAKASENGGTFKAVMKTIERAAQTPGTPATEADTRIKTVDTFLSRLVETFRYMNEIQQATDGGKELGKLYQLLKPTVKGNEELVVAFVEYRNYLDDICTEMQLTERYTKIAANRKTKELVTPAKVATK